MSRRPHTFMLVAVAIVCCALLQVRTANPFDSDSTEFGVVSIQKTTQGAIVVNWVGCTNQIYGILSAGEPEATAVWCGQFACWGEPDSMNWTDAAISEVSQRFYRVIQMSPDDDFDKDGMPNGWELEYGLNLFDAADARTDLDGDGVDNLTEYRQGRDPTRPAIADSSGLVNLTVFTPLE